MNAEGAADSLRALARMARARNGRLQINWVSRAQKPRWRMVFLDGQWYERDGLRALLDRRPKPEVVPASRRRMTNAELRALRDPNPWGLFPPRGPGGA